MIKNMRILAALLFCLAASLVAPLAGAQTGGTYWRLDRSAGLPYFVQFNVDGAWRNIGSVDAAGLFAFTGKINSSTTLSGSGTGQTYQHYIEVYDGPHSNPNGNGYGVYVRMLGRDPASTGFRFAFGAQCQWDTPGDPLSTPGHNGCAGQLAQGILNYPNTGPGAAAVLPGIWGDNWNAVATAKANNASSVIAGEADVSVYGPNVAGDPGATYLQRKGVAVVLIGDGPQGSVRDAGIGFIATSNVTHPFEHIVAFDKLSGGQPIATDGTIIGVTAGSPAMNVANGIDFEYGLIFSGYPFKSKDFYVNADGDVSASNLATKGVVSFLQGAAPANQKLSWIITDPATGALKVQALPDAGTPQTTWVTFTRGPDGAAANAFEKKVYTPPSTAALAGFNIPPGSLPSGTWQDGDLVTSGTSLLVRLNGVTYATAFLQNANVWPGVQTFSVPPIFSTLTGYVKANGASALTASATIPSADFADGNTGTGAVAHAASPAFTGSPTAPTQFANDNSTKLANTAYVDASAAALASAAGGTYAKQTIIHVFTASGIYTPTPGMKFATVFNFGAGGGAGSGARAAPGAAAGGGCGGGGGGLAQGWFSAAQIGPSQAVTIGAAGVGGAPQTADSTAGNNGTAGGATTFGSLLYAGGGGFGQGGALGANCGGGGAGNSSASGGNGAAGVGGVGSFNQGNGGSGVAGANSFTMPGAGSGGSGSPAAGTAGLAGGFANSLVSGGSGGASGGGITAADAASNGGAGGPIYLGGIAKFGAAGTVGAGQDGGAGLTFATNGGPLNQAGTGAGGGASNLLAAAGAGGVGGLCGGAGAGGGASRNGFSSGAGGPGGGGCVIVVEQF